MFERYHTPEFVLFLMMSSISFIFVRNVPIGRNLKPFQYPTSERTQCQLVLLFDHLVKVRSVRSLPCKVTFFPLTLRFFPSYIEVFFPLHLLFIK